jgi:hypothetical protein
MSNNLFRRVKSHVNKMMKFQLNDYVRGYDKQPFQAKDFTFKGDVRFQKIDGHGSLEFRTVKPLRRPGIIHR